MFQVELLIEVNTKLFQYLYKHEPVSATELTLWCMHREGLSLVLSFLKFDCKQYIKPILYSNNKKAVKTLNVYTIQYFVLFIKDVQIRKWEQIACCQN